MRRAWVLTGMAMVALVGAGVAGVTGGEPPVPGPRGEDDPGGVVAVAAGLERFDGCDALATQMRRAATRDPGSLVGRVAVMADGAEMEDGAADTAGGAPAAARTSGALEGTSDTNVQVAGVDEPDVVETDGRRLFTVHDGTLEVVDASGPAPVRLASVSLDPQVGEASLLLDGDRLLATAAGWAAMPQPLAEDADRAFPAPDQPTTSAWLFDVAGDQPSLVAQLDLEGQLVTARGVDGTAHLVVAHRPTPLPVDVLQPELTTGGGDETSEDRLRDLLTGTSGQDWLPWMTHRDADGVRTTTPALACSDVARTDTVPATPATLEVVTLDLHDDDAQPEATTGLATDAQTVTATADRLVVATTAPVTAPAATREPTVGAPVASDVVAPSTSMHTQLHLFDLGPDGATHRASGEVEGRLLNQFSMSLHDQHLRVATTTGQSRVGDGSEASESAVHVLTDRGGDLAVVGSVGGLGKGETIHSVRFLGDEAHVVTFRRTDPLYRVDLSDPTDPRVTGELKITGYSAYLHPLGPDRLLGIGQEATTAGRTTGTQVSVFDVADPRRPRREAQVQLPGATSEAEWDHHAVLVHDDLLVLPFQRWGGPEGPTASDEGDLRAAPRVGALVVELAPELRVRGTLAVDGAEQAIRRALVVDGRLVTVSRAAVTTWDADALTATGRLGL